jgi:hypothetical protein
MTITKVRLEIASTKVIGWNEIDAVGLLNAKTGETKWADSATASSVYDAQPANFAKFKQSILLTGNDATNYEDVMRLRAENQELRNLVEAHRESQARQEKLLKELMDAVKSMRSNASDKTGKRE